MKTKTKIVIALILVLLAASIFLGYSYSQKKIREQKIQQSSSNSSLVNPAITSQIDGMVTKDNVQITSKNTDLQVQGASNATTHNSSLIETILPPKDVHGSVDPRVTQENILQTICVSGYTKTVRPPQSVTNKIKLQKMKEMGYLDSPSDYELDHLISLELGGCPDCIDNLWLESYKTTPNAKTKDVLENYLHKQVCEGKITLQQAQSEIASDWLSAYKKYGLT